MCIKTGFLICILEFFKSDLNFFDLVRSRADKPHFINRAFFGSILPVLVKIIANTVLICNSIWHQCQKILDSAVSSFQNFTGTGDKLLDMRVLPGMYPCHVGSRKQSYADTAGQSQKKKDKYHFHKKKPGFGMGSDFFHKNFLSAHHSEVTCPKFRSLRIRQEPLDEAENWNNVHLCPLM